MPDVSSNAPGVVRMRAALDVHKRTIVCASQPDDPRAGELRLQEIPNTERALRALIRRLGGAEGLVVCYEAGPCGYEPYRLLSEMGVACDIVAPALVPVAPGAVSARCVRSTSSEYSVQPSAATSAISPAR